jgi:hypothetical protein
MLKNIALATVAGLALMTGVAQARPAVQVGVLTCDVDGGWGLVLGSNKELSCVFSDHNGDIKPYFGHITKVGVDVGYVGTKTVAWAVLSVNNGSDDISGTYIGVNAEASAIVGAGVNALVGGVENNFVLQPLSGQIQTGVNAAVAAEALVLEPAE